jgi:origin recognition complex subunit 1
MVFRLEDLVSFEPEAVEFIARKVSAASGDARRALDISRRAAELAENDGEARTPSKKGAKPKASKSTVMMKHVQAAIEEMFSSPKLLAIQVRSFTHKLKGANNSFDTDYIFFQACSLQEQIFLNALVQEFNRTGVEESIFSQVIRQHYTLCDLESALINF